MLDLESPNTGSISCKTSSLFEPAYANPSLKNKAKYETRAENMV